MIKINMYKYRKKGKCIEYKAKHYKIKFTKIYTITKYTLYSFI